MIRAWSRLPILALAAFLVSAGPASAYRFGTDESVHKIQDVTLKGPKEETLYLGHLVRMTFVLAGVSVEDAGYVLGVQGDSKRFFRMPEGDELKAFQRNGFLPDPLPPYSLSALDYLFGYSLWWVIVLVIGYVLWDRVRTRPQATAPAPTSVPPPAPPT